MWHGKSRYVTCLLLNSHGFYQTVYQWLTSQTVWSPDYHSMPTMTLQSREKISSSIIISQDSIQHFHTHHDTCTICCTHNVLPNALTWSMPFTLTKPPTYSTNVSVRLQGMMSQCPPLCHATHLGHDVHHMGMPGHDQCSKQGLWASVEDGTYCLKQVPELLPTSSGILKRDITL